MAVTITNVYDDIFGNLIKMSNGDIELMATVDFGPRIIHFSLADKENMFHQDKNKSPIIDKPIKEHEMDNIHKTYGGHRLWISPETIETCYYPDDFEVKTETIENDGGSVAVRLTAPIEKNVNIIKEITVFMNPSGNKVSVKHQIINKNLWDITIAPWAITIMKKGGKLILPFAKNPTGYLPNRVISLWPYSDMRDNRIYWGKDFITVTHNDKIKQPFKLGINNEDGWAAYFNCGQLFIKEFVLEKDGNYPDYGVNYETYFNDEILEVESLGSFVTLPYKGVEVYYEDWCIYDAPNVVSNDEDEIRNVMQKYIKA